MKTAIQVTFVLALLALIGSIPAAACNQSVYNTNGIVVYTQATYNAGLPTYPAPPPVGQYTPQVGNYVDTCLAGIYSGTELVGSVWFYVGCSTISDISMYSDIYHHTHFGLWDGPTNWSLTSSGTALASYPTQYTTNQWTLVADCDCNPDGTFSGNGAFDDIYPC